MRYVADTVALVRHLRRHRRLGKQARRILRDADAGQHVIYISAITLMEILYLSEARRVDVKLPEVITLVSHRGKSDTYRSRRIVKSVAQRLDLAIQPERSATFTPMPRIEQSQLRDCPH